MGLAAVTFAVKPGTETNQGLNLKGILQTQTWNAKPKCEALICQSDCRT